MTELSLVIIKRARYNELIKKKISSGQGVIPYRRYSPRPALAADLVRFRNRQYSLDERRTRSI